MSSDGQVNLSGYLYSIIARMINMFEYWYFKTFHLLVAIYITLSSEFATVTIMENML